MPIVALITTKSRPAVTVVHAMMAKLPTICTPNCSPRPHASLTLGYAAYCTFLSVQKMPVAQMPHMPQKPCTTHASHGSSILTMSSSQCPRYRMTAPTMPMMNAIHGFTTEQLAVMDTRPARMPLRPIDTSKVPSTALARIVAVMQAEAAEMVVVIATLPATWAAPPEIMSVEPQLNPYQPNHRMNAPSDCSVLLPSCVSLAFPVSGSKRPILGPTTIAPIKPENPPTMCTIPDPAKSIIPFDSSLRLKMGRATPSESGCAPHAESQPAPQPQCTTTG
eukprot:1274553-Rhodomonas_salina.1